MTTFQSMTTPYPAAGLPAFESAYRVGSKVAHELVDHWDVYANTIPTAP